MAPERNSSHAPCNRHAIQAPINNANKTDACEGSILILRWTGLKVEAGSGAFARAVVKGCGYHFGLALFTKQG